MNDFDYDVMQKKRIAASARHRVCGSRSTKCGLPSDHLTACEKASLNGPLMRYELGAPMSYEQFKAMPLDLQQTYLDGLHNRFHVGLQNISRDLFKLSPPALGFHVQRNGLRPFGRGGKRMSPDDDVAWADWLEREKCELVAEILPEKCDEEPSEEPVVEEIVEEDPLRVADLSATFVGNFESEKFLKWVAILPIPEGKVRIRVEVTAE